MQQPEVRQQAGSSTRALIASTYAEGIASNPSALERVTSKEVPAIVRLLLLDLPCFSVNGGSDVNPLLAFFSKLGAVHLLTDVLAKAVHEFRGRLDGTTAASASAAGSSNPAVTSGTVAAASSSTAAAAEASGVPPSPHHSRAVVTLATGLCSRGFQDLGAVAVKTFAEDILWLAASVDGAGGLEQGFVDVMVMGTRSGDSTQIYEGQGKLKAVLESKAVQAAVRGGGGAGHGTDGSEVFWRNLVSERLVNLEAQAPPKLCWRQPDAVFTIGAARFADGRLFAVHGLWRPPGVSSWRSYLFVFSDSCLQAVHRFDLYFACIKKLLHATALRCGLFCFRSLTHDAKPHLHIMIAAHGKITFGINYGGNIPPLLASGSSPPPLFPFFSTTRLLFFSDRL